MTYRDDRDALIAQKEQLEAELNSARDEIARLRGSGVPSNKWLGGPTRIELERHLEGELSETAIEDLIGVIRSRFGGLGRIERLGRTISWRSDLNPRGGGRNVAIHFTRRDGITRIRIEERIGQLAGGLFGGIVGGAGGAGFVNLLVWGLILPKVGLLLGAFAWLIFVFGVVRAIYGAVSQRRVRELERFGAELEQAARDAVAETKQRNVRIADDGEEAEDELVEDEIEPRQKTARRNRG